MANFAISVEVIDADMARRMIAALSREVAIETIGLRIDDERVSAKEWLPAGLTDSARTAMRDWLSKGLWGENGHEAMEFILSTQDDAWIASSMAHDAELCRLMPGMGRAEVLAGIAEIRKEHEMRKEAPTAALLELNALASCEESRTEAKRLLSEAKAEENRAKALLLACESGRLVGTAETMEAITKMITESDQWRGRP